MQIARRAMFAVATLLLVAGPAFAQTSFTAKLYPREEVPAVSSFALGNFTATLNAERTELEYQLTFDHVDAAVTQSHIHLGQRGVNGSIMVFLCSNLANGPAGTQECPPFSGAIGGTIAADDVLAVTSQGVPAGSFFEFSRAVLQGVAYVNVHSQSFPGGELRGQIVNAAAAAADGADAAASE